MADWLDSVELTKGRGVWVRRDVLVEELPSLDLDPASEVSLSLPVDERTTDRTLYARNRDSITRPPAQVRQVRPAAPQPLYDEAPDPAEATPPTFDMGLVPASYMEDEPTEAGADPQAAAEEFRASMDFSDYDEAEDLSTDCVSAAELARAIASARGAHVAPLDEAPPFLDDEVSLLLDQDEVSLTLDLDPSWMVPQQDQHPPASRTPVPMARRPLAERVPAPPRRLAERAPAPRAPQPMRNTVPTYLRTEPTSAQMPGWLVNSTTFVCGIIVGGTCAGTISVLSFAAAILL